MLSKIWKTPPPTCPNQAVLFGVLKALYDMRLPLLSVECIDIIKGLNP